MKQSFSINFKYPFKEKNISIELTGNVTPHHSTPYYIISNIRFKNHPEGPYDAFPEIRIQKRELHGENVWVHMDTQKESELSHIVGQAIDDHLARSTS
ncbi:hypothetical protein D3H65_14830 [Paraflavitalea soli]|uniref:Uncharacterized protein n=1 Tax=Paraflavitalea soli TaxID=2315862 RepID=A0A3B7MQC3_9BACT|nr:hypothetical protein [Paraflavitalea soli]AXY75176.1 hypothetical protein D3H65_14830 [Paraflavitalea soli]